MRRTATPLEVCLCLVWEAAGRGDEEHLSSVQDFETLNFVERKRLNG